MARPYLLLANPSTQFVLPVEIVNSLQQYIGQTRSNIRLNSITPVSGEDVTAVHSLIQYDFDECYHNNVIRHFLHFFQIKHFDLDITPSDILYNVDLRDIKKIRRRVASFIRSFIRVYLGVSADYDKFIDHIKSSMLYRLMSDVKCYETYVRMALVYLVLFQKFINSQSSHDLRDIMSCLTLDRRDPYLCPLSTTRWFTVFYHGEFSLVATRIEGDGEIIRPFLRYEHRNHSFTFIHIFTIGLSIIQAFGNLHYCSSIDGFAEQILVFLTECFLIMSSPLTLYRQRSGRQDSEVNNRLVSNPLTLLFSADSQESGRSVEESEHHNVDTSSAMT